MSKTGIRLETFVAAGRYQHRVTAVGNYQRSLDIPESFVEAQKNLNEALWKYMPEGSCGLISEASYVEPRPKLTSIFSGLLRRLHSSG